MKLNYLLLGLVLVLGACQAEKDESGDSEETDAPAEEREEIVEIEKEVVVDGPASIEFPSLDGLSITANEYLLNEEAPAIVLCHQARFSKFEYEGIAQQLNDRGYNCIAIDQRSGGPIANQVNQTNIRAQAEGKGVDYLDAAQDITAAVNYAAQKYGGPVVLWGSSYSSTLVLYEAIANDNVRAVVSFSPGDYFADTLGTLTDKLVDFEKPMFITCAKNEIEWTAPLVEKRELSEGQVFFQPEGSGHHGSRALWESQDGGEEYWSALDAWLNSL